MSTPPPPDRPTEPLRGARAAPPIVEQPVPVAPIAPVVTERTASVVDPSVILLRLEDTIDSLRSWLVIVSVVAVAALGVAIYALLDDDTSSRGAGSTTGLASDERVSQMENRVDRLSRQVQDLRAGGSGAGDDSAALANRIDELETTVRSLSGQGATEGTQDAIDALAGRIDDLASDVEQLQSAQQP